MAESTAEMAAAVARATTGPDTPDSLRVRRPAGVALVCQVVSLAMACVFAGGVILILAFLPWPSTEAVALKRIELLGWMGLASIACVAISAVSQFFTRVDASAGPGSIHLGGGDDRG